MQKKFLFIGGLALVAFYALSAFSGLPQQRAIPKAVMDNGREVYSNACLACHQADGTGIPRMNPTLVKTQWVNGDKKRLINVVLKGLDEEIEINGDSYSNPMPAQAHLSDKEIADVLTYVRNSFGNKAAMVTPADVATERKKLK
jgi:mono/diheme cytochrome c family protein